jgi:thioredoxin 1
VGEKAGNRAKVYKMNIDENPATANEFGVTAIPTVVVFRGGKVDKTLVGVQREQAYLDALAI